VSKRLVAHTCNPSYLGVEIRRITVQSQPLQRVQEILSQKKNNNNHKKRAGGLTKVVQTPVLTK
jgi:hypothetical protein